MIWILRGITNGNEQEELAGKFYCGDVFADANSFDFDYGMHFGYILLSR